MKLLSVINKCTREQIRNFWILILTVSMAPFFVFIYYLIIESSKPHYDLLILNQDNGIQTMGARINYGDLLVQSAEEFQNGTPEIPLSITKSDNKHTALKRLRTQKTDALVIIPENFSEVIHNPDMANDTINAEIEFIGDLTNINYMVSAIWANEILNQYMQELTQENEPIKIKETSLGFSGSINDFDLVVPGILILSIIMLMFSATVAIVTEVEQKTIIRLKLSKITAFEFLSGVSIVQIVVGLISVLLTGIIAHLLGFDFRGSFGSLLLIAVLTSISIIAFSLILAAITKTVSEVLIVGNFPLFLFMFFTGAAFPFEAKELFTIAGYSVTLPGLMSPSHAIIALRKILILDMGLKDVVPEIIVVVLLTIIYFLIGIWAFKARHMKVE
ncbi:MAG: ABC transporter permease [Bacteroidetes bacterium]|nr:ABC transporter permease [Bacteroidota bacterium]